MTPDCSELEQPVKVVGDVRDAAASFEIGEVYERTARESRSVDGSVEGRPVTAAELATALAKLEATAFTSAGIRIEGVRLDVPCPGSRVARRPDRKRVPASRGRRNGRALASRRRRSHRRRTGTFNRGALASRSSTTPDRQYWLAGPDRNVARWNASLESASDTSSEAGSDGR